MNKKPLLFLLVLACMPLVMGVSSAVYMFGGDSANVLHIDNCSKVNVSVTGELRVDSGEYWFSNCDKQAGDLWNCTCKNNSYDLVLNTLPNTINVYNITATVIKFKCIHCHNITYYCDKDRDGYFSRIISGVCNSKNCVPSGCRRTPGTDCNDYNKRIHPGAKEICNGKDDDCDGKIDENACPRVYYYCDKDKDGYRSSKPSGSCNSFNCVPKGCSLNKGTDCDDNDKSVNPGAKEVCNGKDDDCDGEIDEGCGAEGFCNAITIRGRGDVAGFMRCLRADWKGNEPRKLVPNDCRFRMIGQGRSSSFICYATKQAN